MVVLDVYPARERAEDFPGVSGLIVAGAAADAAGGPPGVVAAGADDAERLLREELREGDLLLTMGAGDVDELGRGGSAGVSAPAGVERDYPLTRLTTVRTGGPPTGSPARQRRAPGGSPALGRETSGLAVGVVGSDRISS